MLPKQVVVEIIGTSEGEATPQNAISESTMDAARDDGLSPSQ